MRISIQKVKSFLIFFSVIIFISCNGSKAYTKKANKLADAGIYKEAVEYYIQALDKNRSNVDAQIGLRKSGQEVMSNYQSKKYKSQSFIYRLVSIKMDNCSRRNKCK